MIIDSIKNVTNYGGLLNHLDDALEAISKLKNYEVGKYTFEGGYFMVQKGETKPMEEGDYEAHRKYVDLQILVEGSEEIAWENLDNTEVIEYNGEKDKVVCKGVISHTMKIDAGMCWIAFPHDAHKAIRHTVSKQSYTKLVVKLPIN